MNNDKIRTVNKNITKTTKLEPMGLGLECRTRGNNYPEVISCKSVYLQTDNITTTERSFGMPTGSSDDIFHRPSAPIAFQVSSSSAQDGVAGTGALTVDLIGIKKVGSVWTEITETLTMNGQTAVATTSTEWFRVNRILVRTTGSGNKNAGEIYASPTGQALTAGVPDANTINAMIIGYSISTGGTFSTASNQGFQYTKGNFFIDPSKSIRIHESAFFDINGGDDFTQYEAGIYASVSVGYDYTGAFPYGEKTELIFTIFTTTGSADAATYYTEFVLTDLTKTNP